jgi:4-amino-4-deoxy-L-arabinose transferase-like glycosyltransferase
MPAWPPPISKRAEILLVSIIILIALLLRTLGHGRAPNGWRDDELSSALVITGHVLDGDFRVYYPDASGHEGLYEYFQAATLLIFGRNEWGVRGPSIFFGVVAILLAYVFTRRLFDWPTASITAAALAVSFWSLMYSRTGQRHISVTVTTLLAFYFLWGAIQQAINQGETRSSRPSLKFALAGLFMGLGFYTYFASRGVPLILIAWAAYLFVWKRDWWRRVWRRLTLTTGLAVLISIPLVVTLRAQPDAETRVEVARHSMMRATAISQL